MEPRIKTEPQEDLTGDRTQDLLHSGELGAREAGWQAVSTDKVDASDK